MRVKELATRLAILNKTGGNENDIGSPDTYFTRNTSRLLYEWKNETAINSMYFPAIYKIKV